MFNKRLNNYLEKESDNLYNRSEDQKDFAAGIDYMTSEFYHDIAEALRHNDTLEQFAISLVPDYDKEG